MSCLGWREAIPTYLGGFSLMPDNYYLKRWFQIQGIYMNGFIKAHEEHPYVVALRTAFNTV